MLKLYKSQFQQGMVDSNSLQRGLITKPDLIIPGIVFLFGYYNRKFGLSYITQGRGNFMMINDDQYEWNVQGRLDKNVAVVKLVTTTTTPGIGDGQFTVRFAEKWFSEGDDVMGDEKVLCRVQGEGRPAVDGVGWDYTLKKVSPDPDLYIPLSDLTAGKKWSIYFNSFEEYSRGGGNRSVTPGKMKNQINTLRKKLPITAHNKMAVAVFEFTIPSSDGGAGKTSKYWCDWEEFLFMVQWFEEVERAGWYSIYNRKPDGSIELPGANSRPVLHGAGVLQQIDNGNSRAYSSLTVKILDESMADASFNMKAADDRKFMGWSGEMGSVEMHNALLGKANQFTLVDTKFITGSGQQLALGGQFVTYRGLNGTETTLAPMPIFDDDIKNTKEHPISRRPIESYRICLMDTSNYNGRPNIQSVSRKSNGVDRSMMRWYVGGSITPNGGADGEFASNSRASDLDGMELNILSQIGKWLQNTTSCVDIYNDKQ